MALAGLVLDVLVVIVDWRQSRTLTEPSGGRSGATLVAVLAFVLAVSALTISPTAFCAGK